MARGPIERAANKWSRKLHRWGAIVASAPLVVILLSGLMLQWKKEVEWIQPRETMGASGDLERIGELPRLDRFLESARGVPEAAVGSWADIDRLDVRPRRGIVKVLCRNRWELQLDAASGAVLSSAYRRSDLLESIHDGSFFHARAKHWAFFPASLVFLGLWMTGLYLWVLPVWARRSAARRDRSSLAG